jgi:hypothetical protein
MQDESIRLSVRMAIFSAIVTMDAAVCFGSADYSYLNKEKLPLINPYFSILGLEEINHYERDNPIESVWRTRLQGMVAISMLSNLVDEIDRDNLIIKRSDKFGEVGEVLDSVMANDDWAVMYGSAVYSEQPGDIDVLVLQDKPNYSSYERMMYWAMKDDYKPKISLQVIPIRLLPSFLTSDPYDLLVPGSSYVLNPSRELSVNKVSKEHRAKICKYRVGYQLVRARNSLTRGFLGFYLNSEAKTRSELKQARFARRNLMKAYGIDVPEYEEIEKWTKEDGQESLRNKLVELNMQLSNQIDFLDKEELLT